MRLSNAIMASVFSTHQQQHHGQHRLRPSSSNPTRMTSTSTASHRRQQPSLQRTPHRQQQLARTALLRCFWPNLTFTACLPTIRPCVIQRFVDFTSDNADVMGGFRRRSSARSCSYTSPHSPCIRSAATSRCCQQTTHLHSGRPQSKLQSRFPNLNEFRVFQLQNPQFLMGETTFDLDLARDLRWGGGGIDGGDDDTERGERSRLWECGWR